MVSLPPFYKIFFLFFFSSHFPSLCLKPLNKYYISATHGISLLAYWCILKWTCKSLYFLVLAQFYWWSHLSCCFGKCPAIFLAVSMHVFQTSTVSFCRRVPQGSGERPDRAVCFYRWGLFICAYVCVCVCRSSHLWHTD